jgi:hypothetical protein
VAYIDVITNRILISLQFKTYINIAVSYKHTIITLKMEAVNTSKTSLNFYQTAKHNVPEDSLRSSGNENRKSHKTGTFNSDSDIYLKSYFKFHKFVLGLYRFSFRPDVAAIDFS